MKKHCEGMCTEHHENHGNRESRVGMGQFWKPGGGRAELQWREAQKSGNLTEKQDVVCDLARERHQRRQSTCSQHHDGFMPFCGDSDKHVRIRTANGSVDYSSRQWSVPCLVNFLFLDQRDELHMLSPMHDKLKPSSIPTVVIKGAYRRGLQKGHALHLGRAILQPQLQKCPLPSRRTNTTALQCTLTLIYSL